MNIKIGRVVSVIIMISFVLANLVCQYEERDIFRSAHHYKTAGMTNPLFLKGTIYFVSDEQEFIYKVGEYSFFGGVVIIAGIIYFTRRREALAALKERELSRQDRE